jgi:hypothetical protein
MNPKHVLIKSALAVPAAALAHRWLPRIATAALLSAAATAAVAAPAAAARNSSAAITAGQPPGYQLVHTGPLSAPPGAESIGSAKCPAGTVVWGGGASITGGLRPQLTVNSSVPNGSGGWAAKVNNTFNTTLQFVVDAVCANKPAGYKIVSRMVDNPPNTQSHATATCPTLDVLLGGGTLSTSTALAAVLTSAWPSSSAKFTGYMDNGTTTDAKLTVFAICGQKPARYAITSNGVSLPPGMLFAGPACPTGSSVVDGGAQDPAHLPSVQIVGSTVQDASSWAVGVANDGQSAEQVDDYAVCAA